MVENIIYFSVKADTVVTANIGPTTTVTTTPQSVSVGLVMSVTPQISESQQIILNVRPTISSIAKFVPDPNPVIPIPNQVPQIRTREIESILSLQPGEIAILGGLMEDRSEQKTGQLPGLADLPFIGELFTTRNNSSRKSELVVLLRPVRLNSSHEILPPLKNPAAALFRAQMQSPRAEILALDTQDALDPNADTERQLQLLQERTAPSAGIWMAIGNLHLRRQQYGQAQTAYQAAHRLAHDHPDPLFNLAQCLEAQGRQALAKHYYQQALQKLTKMNPKDAITSEGTIQEKLAQPTWAAKP